MRRALRAGLAGAAFLAFVLACSTARYGGMVYYRCTGAVDGDTLIVKIEGKETRIGLLGADAPELERVDLYRSRHDLRMESDRVREVGLMALALTTKLARGKMVRLEYDMVKWDVSPTGEQRPLAYVFLRDGTMLNTALVREGLALARTRDVFRYPEAFAEAQAEAALKRKGLFGQPPEMEEEKRPRPPSNPQP